MEAEYISIKGCPGAQPEKHRASKLPRDKLIVITGLSGSGKSSLAFDTIYAEGQRRYVESLSSYARQFLGQMEKPDVDYIEGLSPAISIDQKTTSRNPRSTVGTVTEIHDYLRILFARAGVPHCTKCGKPIERQTVDQMIDQILTACHGCAHQHPGPGHSRQKGRTQEAAGRSGQDRLRPCAGGWGDASFGRGNFPRQKQQAHHRGCGRPDRAPARTVRKRLADSLETALKLSGGLVIVQEVDSGEEFVFNENYLLPGLRPGHRGALAAAVFLQQPLRRLPGLHGPGGHPPGRRKPGRFRIPTFR